jgi:hypothetical protein
MNDERARAYAVLGVEWRVSREELRRHYRELVRRWHPDRFATDPRSLAEAEARMREINRAYQVLTAEPPIVEAPAAAPTPPRPTPSRPGARLTREQIDRMVEAMGTQGPVDQLLEGLGRIGWVYYVVWAVMAAVAAVPLIARYPVLLAGAALAYFWFVLVHRRANE